MATITSYLDAWDSTNHFKQVHLGPGAYVLFDGGVSPLNIVYIGKSNVSIMMRVRNHEQTKDFDKVGIILPQTVNKVFVHNLEAQMVEEYIARFGRLPPYNVQRPRFIPGSRRYNWHYIARRRSDILFN